jgi:Flp pilus assembly pilin Flp
MTPGTYYRNHPKHDAIRRLVVQLLRDDSGITPIENVVAVVSVGLATFVVSRSVACVVTSLLYRIHIVVSLLLH